MGWIAFLIVGSIVVYCLIELKDWIDKDQQ
jgi:hypothetical protein